MTVSFACVSGARVSKSWCALGGIWVVRCDGLFVAFSTLSAVADLFLFDSIAKHGGFQGGAR